jgi:hypothetical protein
MNNRATFSLLTFFGLITVAAVGSAALSYRTTWWASITVTLTLTTCGLAILCAFAFRGGLRAFSFGCSVTMVCYVLLAFHPWLSGLGATLVTTRVLAYTWVYVDKDSAPADEDPFRNQRTRWDDLDYENIVDAYPQIMLGAIFDRSGTETREIRSFFQIGHALFALTFGFLAGLLTYLLAMTRKASSNAVGETVHPPKRTVAS